VKNSELFCTSVCSTGGGACKVSIFELVYTFVNKIYKSGILGILYKILLYILPFFQVYWKDLVIGILTKFILHFSKVSTNIVSLTNFLEIK
jgi:hypothetical protein